MKILFIDTPFISCGTIEVSAVMRKGSVLSCRGESDQSVIMYIEWEDESYARDFEMEIEAGHAVLKWRDGDWQTGKTNGVLMVILVIGLNATIYAPAIEWQRAKDCLRRTYETLLSPFESDETYTLECVFVDQIPTVNVESIVIPSKEE